MPFLAGITSQNPAITGSSNGGISCGTFCVSNIQGGAVIFDSEDRTEGLRADLEWVVGDHTLTAGIDNITFEA